MKEQESIKSIQQQVKRLIKLHDSLKEENKSLKSSNNSLKEELQKQKKAIAELEERNKVLKIAKRLSDTNESTTEHRKKINELLREIDRCIALLKQ